MFLRSSLNLTSLGVIFPHCQSEVKKKYVKGGCVTETYSNYFSNKIF